MARELKLPPNIVSPADVVRLQRSLEMFSDDYHQAKLRRKAHTVNVRPSAQLESLAHLNKVNLTLATERKALLAALHGVTKSAPHITMSFASDPSAQFMSKIVAWLRDEIHPLLLVRIGLQPSIAAGCMVQTPHKVYDFSLQQTLKAQRPELIKRLRDGRLGNKSKVITGQTVPVVAAPAKELAVEPKNE